MKRKFGDRRGWKRVLTKRYAMTSVKREGFEGDITLVEMKEVGEPLWKSYGERRVCLVDNGYQWLQHFPSHGAYTLTTMFNREGQIVQWYIDVCRGTGKEDGVPWMDDLYLDLVLLPTGEREILDADELDDAMESGIIDKDVYDQAWIVLKRIEDAVILGQFSLLKQAVEDRVRLSAFLKDNSC
jgi:uncharacterized protein